MILLLGGTSEAGKIAAALEGAGVAVLVSTATGLATSVRETALVQVRAGMLDEPGLAALIRASGATAVVDATHPYAAEISRNARTAAQREGVPLLRYLRPPAAAGQGGVVAAGGHEEAARRAFRFGRPVLLTIGTRNLAPYVEEARRAAVPVVARVLPASASRAACERAGLPPAQVVPGQGPFTVEQNVEVIRRFGIGVLVTKDGGAEGGVPEKLEAARREGCAVVVVARPEEPDAACRTFSGIGALVEACVAVAAGTAR